MPGTHSGLHLGTTNGHGPFMLISLPSVVRPRYKHDCDSLLVCCLFLPTRPGTRSWQLNGEVDSSESERFSVLSLGEASALLREMDNSIVPGTSNLLCRHPSFTKLTLDSCAELTDWVTLLHGVLGLGRLTSTSRYCKTTSSSNRIRQHVKG